jgi:hypothetical protein
VIQIRIKKVSMSMSKILPSIVRYPNVIVKCTNIHANDVF